MGVSKGTRFLFCSLLIFGLVLISVLSTASAIEYQYTEKEYYKEPVWRIYQDSVLMGDALAFDQFTPGPDGGHASFRIYNPLDSSVRINVSFALVFSDGTQVNTSLITAVGTRKFQTISENYSEKNTQRNIDQLSLDYYFLSPSGYKKQLDLVTKERDVCSESCLGPCCLNDGAACDNPKQCGGGFCVEGHCSANNTFAPGFHCPENELACPDQTRCVLRDNVKPGEHYVCRIEECTTKYADANKTCLVKPLELGENCTISTECRSGTCWNKRCTLEEVCWQNNCECKQNELQCDDNTRCISINTLETGSSPVCHVEECKSGNIDSEGKCSISIGTWIARITAAIFVIVVLLMIYGKLRLDTLMKQKEEIEAKRAELAEKEQELDQSEKKLNEKKKRFNELTSNIVDKRKELAELRKEFDSIKDEVAEKDSLKQKIQYLSEDLKKLHNEQETVEQDIKKKQTEKNELEESKKLAEKDLASQKQMFETDLTDRMQEYSKELAKLDKAQAIKLSEHKKDYEQKRKEIEDKYQEVQSLRKRTAEDEEELIRPKRSLINPGIMEWCNPHKKYYPCYVNNGLKSDKLIHLDIAEKQIFDRHKQFFIDEFGEYSFEYLSTHKIMEVHHIDHEFRNYRANNLAIIPIEVHRKINHSRIPVGNRKAGIAELKRLRIKQPHLTKELNDQK